MDTRQDGIAPTKAGVEQAMASGNGDANEATVRTAAANAAGNAAAAGGKHRRESGGSESENEAAVRDEDRPAKRAAAQQDVPFCNELEAPPPGPPPLPPKQTKSSLSMVAPVTEGDVGIGAYVDECLVPIQGGIIKQRFSDFHVREVAPDGHVCRITSLLPPAAAEGGTGLVEALEAERAERNDPSGQVRQERLEQEEQRREARQAERKKLTERTYEWTPSTEQAEKLQQLFGSSTAELKVLWQEGPRSGKWDDRSVFSAPISVKDERRAAHQLVREVFEGLLVTEAVDVEQMADEGTTPTKASTIKVRWGAGTGTAQQKQSMRHEPRGQATQPGAGDSAPPYVHFLLQKTNRDTQDALNMLARSLGLIRPGQRGGGAKSVNELAIAGTKDKRGVTVQRVSLKRGRRRLDDVWRALNGISGGGRSGGGGGYQRPARSLLDAVSRRGERGLRCTHITYAAEPLHLGAQAGNEFGIVLRNVKVQSRTTVDAAMHVLKTKGFVNYYGMQRFGTSSISTHRVGIALLRDDYRTAVQLIMAPREGDVKEAVAARVAYCRGELATCMKLFPHGNVPERSIVSRMRAEQHHFVEGQDPSLSKHADWRKYFSALPRTLRSMYVHAYQSYAWNCLATERVRRYGVEQPVVGDYVLLQDGDGQQAGEDASDGVDAVGADADDIEIDVVGGNVSRKRVKVLETEADVRQFSIHDVVIPLFGSDVVPPTSGGWMAELYSETLARDGLTPETIQRCGTASSAPEMRLRGDYRTLLHLPRNVAYRLVRYTDPDVNLLQSDEDRILGLDPPPPQEADDAAGGDAVNAPFVALVLHFTLGVSAYATMALREVLKQETSMAHQRDLTARGEDRIVIESSAPLAVPPLA